MEYISHEKYKSFRSKLQAEARKGVLKEGHTPSQKELEDNEVLDRIDDMVDKVFENDPITPSKLVVSLAEKIKNEWKSSRGSIQGDEREFVKKHLTTWAQEQRAKVGSKVPTNKGKGTIWGDDWQHVIDVACEYDEPGDDYWSQDKGPGKPSAWQGRTNPNEGLTTPPLQATGPTVVTKEEQAPFGFSVLSPDEREQLKEYINSIKTIKEEIAKLAAKAGKKVKESDLGGDRTGLVMTKQTMSEMDGGDRMSGLVNQNHLQSLLSAAEGIIGDLKADGFEEDEIIMYLNHEIEKKAKEAIDSQYDPH